MKRSWGHRELTIPYVLWKVYWASLVVLAYTAKRAVHESGNPDN